MRHKTRKTAEQKTAEEYFPVNKDDLKYAVEKQYKSQKNSVEKIESVVKPREKRKINRIPKKISYSPQKIALKKQGYELIITEKPQAALKIASALGKSSKKNIGSVSYYEVEKKGKKIIVACAVGHLLNLTKVNSQEIPIFDIIWAPNYMINKKNFTKKYYDVISKLIKKAGSLTVATDYDVEGEVIGWNVVRFICGQEDANRMKFSTLTSSELNKAYEEKTSSLNWGQAFAGETRHYLDWFYGINLSRALMNAIKTTGRFKIMSIGRVQGPTLNMIVQKEKKIQEFKSKKYWNVFATVKNSHTIELKYVKDIFDKKYLEKFDKLKNRKVQAQTKKTEKTLLPPPPFNLTTLQTEAYKLYGIIPSKTLQIAQSLYLSGLISYPRTSSQKLPISINYRKILGKLSKKYNVENLIKRQKPIEGEKTDPAHPSIYPTGEQANKTILSGNEQKIYDLIIKRFLALFCDNAKIYSKTITVEADTNERKIDSQGNLGVFTFSVNGLSIKEKAWMNIYPLKLKEKEIPDLEGEVTITKIRHEEKETKPPRRYSPASIISELEKRNLGTKATRSSILETLYNREYIKNKNVEATPLGISLISTLEKHSPIIIDAELTRNFEKDMESVEKIKTGFKEKQKKIIDRAKQSIKKIIKQFNKSEKEIGKDLLIANLQFREQQKEENKIHPCPVCQKGNLAITYSRKTRRNFIACNAYPKCRTTYSLPPNGTIKKTDKVCERCGFPMLMSVRARRKPWIFCFNTECESNRERIEKYKKREQAEDNNS